MSPLEIEIIFHYYCSPGDFRNGDFSAPAVRSAIDSFKAHNDSDGPILVENIQDTSSEYTITNRGKAYVYNLCSMPLPVCKWIIPDQKTSE